MRNLLVIGSMGVSAKPSALGPSGQIILSAAIILMIVLGARLVRGAVGKYPVTMPYFERCWRAARDDVFSSQPSNLFWYGVVLIVVAVILFFIHMVPAWRAYK